MRRKTSRAFTLVELLAVVAIIGIATAVIVPSFGRLIESVNFSASINSVTTTLGAARSLAVQQGRHTAVAFLFDTKSEILTLQILEEDRGGADVSLGGQGSPDRIPTLAMAFRPATGRVPVDLPTGIGVYGLPTLDQIVSRKLNRPLGNQNVRCYDNYPTFSWYSDQLEEPAPNEHRPLWLFPQNDGRMFMSNDPPEDRFTGVDPWAVFDGSAATGSNAEAEAAVRHAQSFAILFSPEGRVVDQPVAGAQTYENFYIEYADGPVARDGTEPYDSPDRFDPEEDGRTSTYPGGAVPDDQRVPNREVMLRTVEQLAVVDFKRLADAIGTARPWYVRPASSDAPQPAWLDDLGYFENDRDNARHRLVSLWIDENGEILSFSRYTGAVLRRKPQ